jgi:hypothetical protein
LVDELAHSTARKSHRWNRDVVWKDGKSGVTKVSDRNTDMLDTSAIRHVALDGRQVFFGGDDEELFSKVGGKRVA